MKAMSIPKSARALRALLLLTLLGNLLALPAVPALVYFRSEAPHMSFAQLQGIFAYDIDDGLGNLLQISLAEVWQDPYTAALSLFLLFSGVCTAVILAQGILVLSTILDEEDPFSMRNVRYLRRAAQASFAISAAALARVVFSVAYFRSLQPALSYNALFAPIFLMAGLLCLVMSALFRQAAEMKAENDLTI